MMKIVAEKKVLNIEMIKKGIQENIDLMKDITYMDSYTGDEYKTYRITKAIEKIEMYLKEVKLTKK